MVAGGVRQLALPVIALTMYANHPKIVVGAAASPVGAAVSVMVLDDSSGYILMKESAVVPTVIGALVASIQIVSPLAVPSRTGTSMVSMISNALSASSARVHAAAFTT